MNNCEEGCMVMSDEHIGCCSVAQLCPTLCDPMDCSMPGFPVPHHLPELAQTHVHWVGDAIQPSCPLSSPLSSSLKSFPALGSFPINQFFTSGGQMGASASAWVLPRNIQGRFPLGLTGLISLLSKRFSRVSTPQFKSISSSVLSLLYGSILSSIHDYWRNHNLDYTDVCRQSNVSAF